VNREVELPVVNEAACIGCGDCVDICPTQCLDMRGKIAWLPRPADCTSCAACMYVCPTDAITLEMQTLREPDPTA
jgi:ferredoxin